MTKKGANHGKNTHSGKVENRRQNLRRRVGDVKRVEVVLNADNERDQYIASNLNQLERGTTSEFVRCAIEEKIAREVGGGQDLGALYDMIDALSRQIAALQHRAPTSTPRMIPPPPVFEDDDPVAMTIKADTSIDAGANFLASLANLQM